MRTRTQEEWNVCCMSCGHSGAKFVTMRNNLPPSTTSCPKCSNEAFVISIGTLGHFMSKVCKEISLIKLDMIDLQEAEEER